MGLEGLRSSCQCIRWALPYCSSQHTTEQIDCHEVGIPHVARGNRIHQNNPHAHVESKCPKSGWNSSWCENRNLSIILSLSKIYETQSMIDRTYKLQPSRDLGHFFFCINHDLLDHMHTDSSLSLRKGRNLKAGRLDYGWLLMSIKSQKDLVRVW